VHRCSSSMPCVSAGVGYGRFVCVYCGVPGAACAACALPCMSVWLVAERLLLVAAATQLGVAMSAETGHCQHTFGLVG
jgi:hypothetical protein